MPRILFAPFSFVVALLFTLSSLADDNLPAKDRLKSCDTRIALVAAKEILSDPKTLKEPLEMFSPAFILFQNGEKDDAIFWFYAAQLRVRYQLAFEKGDRGQLLSIMLMTIGPPINNYAFQDVRKLDRIIDRVLEWDKTAPNPFREKSRTRDIEVNLEKVYSGLHDLKVKLVTEKDDIEQKARAAAPQIGQMSLQSKTRPCRPGEPDPAYANRTVETEQQGAGSEWHALNLEGADLFAQRQYDRGVIVAKKALELAEKNVGPDHPNVATSLSNLTDFYRILGQYAQAVPLCKRALVIREKSFGPNHRDTVYIRQRLAEMQRMSDRQKEAAKIEQPAADSDIKR